MKKGYKLLTSLALSLSLTTASYAASKLAGKTVKIGVMADMSGTYADLGGPGSTAAAQMAVDDFIAKYKPEFKVEVVSADHQNKVDIGSAVAKEWFDRDGVDMITDLTNSGVALAVNDIAEKANKITMVTTAGSSKLTQEACKKLSTHYTYNTYALANVAAKAMIKSGSKKWFIITNNYAFGLALESDTTAIVKANGGEIVGTIRHPFDTTDFSSFLLQAQNSGADVVAIANAGGGMLSAVKQANEFGITKKQKIVTLLTDIVDVHALGLKSAQGMVFTVPFYWNRTPETAAWSRRFFEKMKKMPTAFHAGTYSATMHYLIAIHHADSKDADVVMAKIKEVPVNDFFAKNTKISEDGLLRHEMYLVQVKSPEESKESWDYFKLIEAVPGDQAFEPLSTSRCPLVKK